MTLDLDFASPLRFPPWGRSGIVVLMLRSPLLPAVAELVETLVGLLETRSPSGEPWIVEPGRLPIHLDETAE